MRSLGCRFIIIMLSLISFADLDAQPLRNTITLDNQSGEPALVKLIGPSAQVVEVSQGEKRTVNVAAGDYYLLARYGADPKRYSYSRGNPFKVEETAIQHAMITITLHKVVGGNYPMRPTSSEEFDKAVAVSKGLEGGQKTEPHKRFIIEIMPNKDSGGASRVVLSQNVSDSFQVTSSGAGYRLAMVFVSGRFEPTIWDAGSEVAFHGKVTLQDYTLDSDLQYPLTFKLVGNIGYVYLCGRGTVTTKDGQTHRLGYEDTIHTWLPRLHSKDPLDREGATQALGWLTATPQEKEQTVPALSGALQDEKAEVRRNAAEALGKLNDARATESLFTAWQDPDNWVVAVAMEVLLDRAMAGSLSEQRFAQLIQLMLDPAAQPRRLSAVSAGGRTAKFTVDLLLDALSNKRPATVRIATVEALVPVTVAAKYSMATSDTRAIVESLSNYFSNSAEATEVRIAAAKALGQIGDIRAVEPLMQTLLDSVEATEVRVEAAKALGQIGDARVSVPLRDLRDKVNDEVRAAIDATLRKLERK